MDKRKYFIIRLFFLYFAWSVSVAVLPFGIINVHGLFGEISQSTVVEDKDREIENIKATYQQESQTVKGINILNTWFEILLAVVCICFFNYFIRLPRGDTIVTLKVRIDN